MSVQKKIDSIHGNKNEVINLNEYSKKIIRYIGNLKDNGITIFNTKVNYDDNLWDFNEQIIDNASIINFNGIEDSFIDISKLYVIDRCNANNVCITVIKNELLFIKKIIKEFEDIGVVHPLQINSLTIKSVQKLILTKSAGKRIMKVIIRMSELLYHIGVFNGDYNELYNYYSTLDLKEKRYKSYSIIPIDIFNKIVNCAVNDLQNPSLSDVEREEAAISLLFSQTGLRNHDIRMIEYDMLCEERLKDSEKIIYFLKYIPSKKRRNSCTKINDNDYVITFMTEYAVLAYKELCAIHNKKNINSNKIFMTNTGKLYSHHRIFSKTCRFYARNAIELGIVNIAEQVEGFNSKKIVDINCKKGITISKRYLDQFDKLDILSFPTTHQYRVTVCTILYMQGKDISWIKKHMNHLSYETTCGYIQNMKNEKDDIEHSKRLLKELIKSETEIIGVNSDEVSKSLLKYIETERVKVNKSIEDIITSMSEKVPIRKKKLGYCIKSFFGRRCEIDDVSDKLACALGNCPNSYYVLEECAEIYERCKELKEIIKFNEKNDFIMQAKKERKKLKYVLTVYLIPAIKKIVEKERHWSVNNKDEKFINFISNIDAIKFEVEKWQKEIEL